MPESKRMAEHRKLKKNIMKILENDTTIDTFTSAEDASVLYIQVQDKDEATHLFKLYLKLV